MDDVRVKEMLLDAGFVDVVYFDSFYDNALIGISNNSMAIYDYEKMIECLVREGATYEEAMDDIDYNVIGSLPCVGSDFNAPIIMYSTNWLGI